MTSTGFSTGFSADSRSSCKVMKPPGGGSSDLFGGDNQGTPRSTKNHMKSNIFSAPECYNKTGDKPRKVQTMDSYNRLFGEPNRATTPAKNHMKSSIPIGGSDTAKYTNGKKNGNDFYGQIETNSKEQTNGNGASLSSYSDGGSSKNGNPVTGEGYNNGKANGDNFVSTLNGMGQANKNRRVPPGGFSNGLW